MEEGMKFLLAVLVRSAIGRVSVDHVYALGDSFTDTGRLFEMTGGLVPSRAAYWEGRFSDGRTWVEYLATKLNANLTSLAVGGATTDSKSNPDAYNLGIPGCVQQAEEFAEKAPSGQRILVTIAFTGNDFFGHNGNVKTYLENMEKCMRTIAKSRKARHILVSTSFAPKLLPFFNQNQIKSLSDYVAESARNISNFMPGLLSGLRQEYRIHFYRYSLGATLEGLSERGLEYCDRPHLIFDTDTCNHFTPFEVKQQTEKCKYKKPIFHDQLHPTSRAHEAIAMRAYQAMSKQTGDFGGIPYSCFPTIYQPVKITK